MHIEYMYMYMYISICLVCVMCVSLHTKSKGSDTHCCTCAGLLYIHNYSALLLCQLTAFYIYTLTSSFWLVLIIRHGTYGNSYPTKIGDSFVPHVAIYTRPSPFIRQLIRGAWIYEASFVCVTFQL